MRLLILLGLISFCHTYATLGQQNNKITGRISSDGKGIPFASIGIPDTKYGTTANAEGIYSLEGLSTGKHKLTISAIGYKTITKEVNIKHDNVRLNIELSPENTVMDQVVVTGTRTAKKITNSPVIVNVINEKVLENTQSVTLSEGLKYQPGLRVETDCQTCNYTQIRMNGLQGGYSQVLINNRPIFSPLTGLYGLEQIPTNMIERIEVVRGGGSALYGSGAVGGTVNVITKIPEKPSYSVSTLMQSISGAPDYMLSGNATVLNESGTAGASFFINRRNRDWWDANGDNFSELPKLTNNSFGSNIFLRPNQNHSIDISLSSLQEYRYGGEMVEEVAHLTKQAEERTHNIVVGNIDYRYNFNNQKSSLLSYFAYQHTDREHYTGVSPDQAEEIDNHLQNPPYGNSINSTIQGGIQFNHEIQEFLDGSNLLTVGLEYIKDDIVDKIEAYDYNIDQETRNTALFMQSDWEITDKVNLLSGVRIDHHNLVQDLIASPRFSLLYKPIQNLQLRGTWGTGFRAPQAFDADLHIAFAGGGISRIQLSDALEEERSNSYTASINYDKAYENFIWGFTLEGFNTYLYNAFYLQPLGEDAFGEVFEKQNGSGATVKGITVELRANYKEQIQFDAGFTSQRSTFDEAVEYSDVLNASRNFLRTPNHYGYATASYALNKRFNLSANLNYTGSMMVLHLAGAPEQTEDAFKNTKQFTNIGIRASYTIPLKNLSSGLELLGGIKNLANSYQSDFDSGKNRDSNYVYGPSLPRTYFVGLKIKSL